MTFPAQAFILSNEIFSTLSRDEVDATWDGLVEIGLAQPPFEDFDIVLPAEWLLVFCAGSEWNEAAKEDRLVPGAEFMFRFLDCTDTNKTWHLKAFARTQAKPKWVEITKEVFDPNRFLPCTDDQPRSMAKIYEDGVWEIYCILIVLLATRNVEKAVQHNKRVKLGIGRGKTHEYVTTLRVGQVLHNADGDTRTHMATDTVRRRPHLRRGHIRRQAHGPAMTERKSIWIAPMFINADEAWIGARKGYKVVPARSPT